MAYFRWTIFLLSCGRRALPGRCRKPIWKYSRVGNLSKIVTYTLIPLTHANFRFPIALSHTVWLFTVDNRRHGARRDVKYIPVGFIATRFPNMWCWKETTISLPLKFASRRYFMPKKPERSPPVFRRRTFKFNARCHRGKKSSASCEHSSSTKAVILNGWGARSHV